MLEAVGVYHPVRQEPNRAFRRPHLEASLYAVLEVLLPVNVSPAGGRETVQRDFEKPPQGCRGSSILEQGGRQFVQDITMAALKMRPP